MAEAYSVYNSQLDAFELYHQIQEDPSKPISYLSGPALPALGHAIAGAVGASISNVVTYPLALIITRLQIQHRLGRTAAAPSFEEYRSIQDAVKKIYEREGGLSGFYVGISSDTCKTIADSFLFFLAYTFIRQSRLRSRSSSKHLPVLDELSVGFLAGAFSKFLTTPIAAIVTRKQTSALLSARSPSRGLDQRSIRSIALQIRKEKGIRGFWSGYSASLILTLNPSLTFLFFETLKRSILTRAQRANPSARVTFLLAAISKACASSITYPFSLAKSRLQASVRTAAGSDDGFRDAKHSATPRTRVPPNVLTTIIDIMRTEGFFALYEGLGGEVLKGFFSHGITMIVKEAVHKVVIQLYYVILKLLRKYPSPAQLAEMAALQAAEMREQAQLAAGKAETDLKDAAGMGKHYMKDVVESVKSD